VEPILAREFPNLRYSAAVIGYGPENLAAHSDGANCIRDLATMSDIIGPGRALDRDAEAPRSRAPREGLGLFSGVAPLP
jgi:hypothetical protein